MENSERLVLRQSAMQFSDGRRATISDVKAVLPSPRSKLSADVVHFTELDEMLRRIVTARCKGMGYSFHFLSTVGLALHPRHILLEEGGVNVLEPYYSKNGPGNYRARGIVETTFKTPAKNKVIVHGSHWITDANGNLMRARLRRQQSEAMVERVRLHSRGSRISFWMGDTNEDEGAREQEVQKPLTRGKLISIYDALGEYPNTHESKTIDVIGHYAGDARVTPVEVHVSKRRNSDHKSVDAIYEIRHRKR